MKKQPVFVAVGALHLSGEEGLVQQLRDKGFTVKPISF
ncbi:MAG: TraB/GumN family protein [Flavobacteriales bacterium]|nr:TraB/GumN family protein [Flavobacteriales bacterium]